MPDNESRLERLWSGRFGDEYVARNPALHERRRSFWHELVQNYQPKSVLEIGCNVGGNLRIIAEVLPPQQLTGVDVNESALEALRERLPGVAALKASATDLPFADGAFDLVCSVGVLIHQGDEALEHVITSMHRCAARYLFIAEYYSPEPMEVFYRGERGALFKRDYGGIFQDRFPGLSLLGHGFLSADDGWGDDTWWLFEKGAA